MRATRHWRPRSGSGASPPEADKKEQDRLAFRRGARVVANAATQDTGTPKPLVPYELFIGGAAVAAEDGGTFQSVDPTQGAPWAVVAEGTPGDVDRAVRAAHET